MKYFFIVCDRLSDQHAAKLVNGIRRNDIRAEIAGVGGDFLKNADISILSDFRDFAQLSIINVIGSRVKRFKAMRSLKKDLVDFAPEVLVVVGYSIIGLDMASHAKKFGIKTCLYSTDGFFGIKKRKLEGVKVLFDKIMLTRPFEVGLFMNKKDAEYIGNNTIDIIRNYTYNPHFETDPNQTTIAVILGNSPNEIRSASKLILKISKMEPTYQFLIDGQQEIGVEKYLPFRQMQNVEIHFDKKYDILKRSNAAIVASPVATLEAALLNCPQIAIGFTSKWTSNSKRVSLANQISQKKIIKEFYGKDKSPIRIINELNRILNDHHYCAGIMQDYQEVLDKIGAESPSRNAARIIIEWMED